MDLKRLQQLAEAVGWKIETHDWREGYVLTIPLRGLDYYESLTPIRERLEQEYRKLAIEVDRLWLLRYKAEGKVPCYEHSFGYDTFTAIADELAAMKEPTMVEKLKEKKAGFPEGTDSPIVVVLDALIDLYERDSRTRKEGE